MFLILFLDVFLLFFLFFFFQDADTVERLNESGELRRMLKPYQVIQDKSLLETNGEQR